jgi:hypothetical protein
MYLLKTPGRLAAERSMLNCTGSDHALESFDTMFWSADKMH